MKTGIQFADLGRMTLKHALTLAGWVFLTAFATACAGGGSASMTSPTSASGSGASITGTVGTSFSAIRAAAASFSGPAQSFASGSGLTVSVTGTNMSSPVDGSGHFALNGVPAGDRDLHISGGGADAHVPVNLVSDHEHINVTLTVNGSAATVEDSEREDDDDNEAEVEGIVTAIDPVARTLTVRGKVITVPADVPIRHGHTILTFADIKVGDRVHVHGTKTGTGITAIRVKVQNAASNHVSHDDTDDTED